MQWITWWPGDYLKDTGDLSLNEHGAYRVLLDHYYATDGRLRADQTALFRICRAMTEDEQTAVGKVVKLFFTVDAEGWLKNKKADKVMREAVAFIEAKREAGKAGAAKRWHGTPNGDANGTPNGIPNSKQHGKTIASTPTPTPKAKNLKHLGGKPPDGFSKFWEAYPSCPRKEAKGKCLSLWLTKRFEEVAPEILAHVEAKKANGWNDPQYIPAPLVYLNGQRWEGAELAPKSWRDDPAFKGLGL